MTSDPTPLILLAAIAGAIMIANQRRPRHRTRTINIRTAPPRPFTWSLGWSAGQWTIPATIVAVAIAIATLADKQP